MDKITEDVRYATFWQRLVAIISDVFLLVLLELIFFLLLPRLNPILLKLNKTAWFGGVLITVYFVGMEAIFGATLGKMIWGLKIVNNKGKRPTIIWLLIRETAGKLLSIIFFWLGFLAMWLSDDGLTWHDKLTKTRVITDRKNYHKRNIFWFYGLTMFLLLIQGYTVYETIKNQLSRKNEDQPCVFYSERPDIKTNHFDFYIEDLNNIEGLTRETELFESAFDFSFWSISGVKDKVTRTSVCLYSNEDTYNVTEKMTVTGNAAGFYDTRTSTISMSPDYFRLYDRSDKFNQNNGIGTLIYHEIAHYVLDNYFYQNASRTYLDSWFNEGLAQHFEGNCLTADNKYSVNLSQVQWGIMETPYFTDRNFDIYAYYRQACLMTEFLMDRNGNSFIKNVIKNQVKEGLNTRDAIEKESGSSYEQLEKEWQLWLKK
jgi:uncharacterized RDD family membrane protein YckC